MKTLLWVIPVVFGAGGFYVLMTSTSAQLVHEVAEVQGEIEEHTKLKERIDTILTEQRAIRSEQADQAQSLAAICQATGARCR